MKIIGVMSGSSLDGLDFAVIDVAKAATGRDLNKERKSAVNWELLETETIGIPSELKKQLQGTINQIPRDLIQTEYEYSRFVAHSLNRFKTQNRLKALSATGIHGHTIIHSPERNRSWQLLNGGLVSELINLPVICDFRNQDMTHGGQGTPMAALADRDLFWGHKYYLNLGGIANISVKSGSEWSAFDICPCNQLLDYFARIAGSEYDSEGQLAASGKIVPELLIELKSNPYLRQAPPKSLDNSYARKLIKEIKGYSDEQSVQDILRTIVEYIVDNIVMQVPESTITSSLMVSGGGTFNSFLMSNLQAKLKKRNVELLQPEGDIINYKEAILVAYAAYRRLEGKPNFIPSATGAMKDVSGGALYLPSPNTNG